MRDLDGFVIVTFLSSISDKLRPCVTKEAVPGCPVVLNSSLRLRTGVLVGVDVVPSAEQFRPVVLSALADGQPRQVREIYRLAADGVGLSEAARDQRTP